MDSLHAMYRGMIALMHVSGPASMEQREIVQTFINHDQQLSAEQKTALSSQMEHVTSLDEIWPAIKDVQDRARLLNVAERIFRADGEYCDKERAVYGILLQKQLGTIDRQVADFEINSVRKKMQEEMAQQKSNERFGWLHVICKAILKWI